MSRRVVGDLGVNERIAKKHRDDERNCLGEDTHGGTLLQ
jgi:hypothetical protein